MMDMKKAIVTGASRGIGRGIALKLASQGYDVAISYNSREEEAKALAEEITAKYGTKCFCYQATLQNPGVPEVFFQKAVSDLGGLDLLVCNAGVTIGGSILDLTEEKLNLAVDLDYKSYLLMTSYAANYMVDHEIRGNIIYITSTHGERAYASDALYGSVKAALNRAVQSIAIELGYYGIRVNAIAPGYTKVRTNKEWPGYEEFCEDFGRLLPANRIGVPEDIGNAVAFLSSERARYITGITLRVDGGLILPGMPETKDPAGNVRIWGYREHYGFRKPKAEDENQNKKGENKS